MIPKSAESQFVPTNYRPISLLNSMVKLYEIFLLSPLRKLTSNFIRLEQFAFWQGHSTSNQITKLMDELAFSFNKKGRMVAVFLDYEKVFDKVWHQSLLAKITDLYPPIQLVNTLSIVSRIQILQCLLGRFLFNTSCYCRWSLPKIMPFPITIQLLH